MPNIKSGYIQSPYNPRDHKFRKLGGFTALKGKPLNPTGQWISFTPQEQLQDKLGPTNSCTVFGSETSLSILLKAKGIVEDFSKRFLAIVGNVDQNSGADPVHIIDTARKTGLIDEIDMPYVDSLTPDQFYEPKPMPQNYLDKAQKFLKIYGIGYDDVFPDEASIKEALTYSPLGVAVKAWFPKDDADGEIYFFPDDINYNHFVTLVGYVDKKWYIVSDSYFPQLKRIAWGSTFGKVLRYAIGSPSEIRLTILDLILQKITILLHLLSLQIGKIKGKLKV